MTSTSQPERICPSNLRVRYKSAPNNVPLDAPPRFSWAVDEPTWGCNQAAYRLLVARSREALFERAALWDSGRIDSSRSTDVAYRGPSLAPDTTYYWMVKVWNDNGEASDFSEPVAFSTAVGDSWSGQWITRQPDQGDSNGYRSRWRACDDDPTEWVQVDLGSPKEFVAVELYPAEPYDGATTPDGRSITALDTESGYADATVAQGPVAFGFPTGYRIEISNDPQFETAQTVVDETDTDQSAPRRDPVVHEIDTVRARYIRVVATTLNEFTVRSDHLREEYHPWRVFALAALAVRDETGTDVAQDRAVEASSSVESECWGRAKLTDGEYASTMVGQSPLFRTEFELTKPVSRARAHFVGLGYGELYVNGENVGDDVLNPSWTQYDERVCYTTYEIDDVLVSGTNAVGIWLGRGWFSRSARHWSAFGSPRALLQLTVEYEDGTTREVTTDDNWRTASSPIIENDIYDGETYDARLEQPGWAESGFDDADWEPAVPAVSPEGDLYPQQTDPIAVTDVLTPVAIHDHENGPIVDFGQNHTGWLELDIVDGDAGNEVTIRHAEALDTDGNLQTVDLRTADATDTYVVADEQPTTYEPRFTYHGYRYAQISGYPGELSAEQVRSKVVHTAMDDGGEFACSNSDLAAVQENSRWGLRSNAHSVPTDCPQRDERMGFTGDGHIAARALHYNFDAVRFHEKWIRDHVDTQSRHGYVPAKCPFGAVPSITDPSWTVSLLEIPWHCYQFYGDEGVLKRNYESLRQYVDFWDSVAEDALVPDEYAGYGDWLALENVDGRRGRPADFFTNAYYYRSVDLLSDIAHEIGCSDDASRYRERATEIAAAFNDRYFDAGRNAYEPGTQASFALPLSFGIAPDECADVIAANLARKVAETDDGQLRTGFLGTRPLLSVLTEYGYADLAYDIVSTSDYPGWVYMLQQGATTIWERWNSDEAVGSQMNSLNHSPFTLISEWFFDSLVGINVRLGSNATYPVEIAPTFVDGLAWAEGSTETPRGEVAVQWETIENGYELTITLPWNLPARIVIPRDDVRISLDGQAVRSDGTAELNRPDSVQRVKQGGQGIVLSIEPGTHQFRIT